MHRFGTVILIIASLARAADPQSVPAASPDFFETIASKPILGRTFAAGDHKQGATGVTVLSETLWERKFARDPKIIDRVIRLNGEPYQIIGVAPRVARVPAEAELWAPVVVDEKFRARKTGWFNVIARLKPGAAVKPAGAEMRK